MLHKVLKNFHWQRTADKNGPKKLLVLVLGGSDSKAILLERGSKKSVKVAAAYTMGEFNTENGTFAVRFDGETEIREVSLKQLLDIYHLSSQYCSVVVRKKTESIRLVQVPSKAVQKPAETFKSVKELIGAGDADNIVYQPVESGGSSKALVPMLGVSMADEEVSFYRKLVEQAGMNPVSLVLGSVPVLDMSLRLIKKNEKEFKGFLYIGDTSSTLSVVSGSTVAMVRQFGMGRDEIVRSIMTGMSMDMETALDLFKTDSFDYSAALANQAPWIHQIGISMDYVERRFNQTVSELKILGPGAVSKVLSKIIADKTRRTVDPFDLKSHLSDMITCDAVVWQEDFLPGIFEGVNIILGGFSDES